MISWEYFDLLPLVGHVVRREGLQQIALHIVDALDTWRPFSKPFQRLQDRRQTLFVSVVAPCALLYTDSFPVDRGIVAAATTMATSFASLPSRTGPGSRCAAARSAVGTSGLLGEQLGETHVPSYGMWRSGRKADQNAVRRCFHPVATRMTLLLPVMASRSTQKMVFSPDSRSSSSSRVTVTLS
jgi:hypothetical protein